MIAGTTPKPHLRRCPHLSYTHYNKARHEFLTSSPNKRSIRDKTQRNRINRMRLTSPKMHLSKKIHDWHRPLRIVPYRAIIYASFSKRAPMTVTWSNFVNNTLIASRQAYIGPRNRHWGAFPEKCIKNRTIRHDMKGAEPIVYCFRKMHLWGSNSHVVYSIPLCFYLGWMSKIRVWPYT